MTGRNLVLGLLLSCCACLPAGPVQWLPGVISQTGLYALAASEPWWPDEWEDSFIPQGLLHGTSALAPLGLYQGDFQKAAAVHAVQGTAASLAYLNHRFWDQSYLSSSLMNVSVTSGMYGFYAALEDEPLGLRRLAASPVLLFDHPLVWGSTAGFFALGLVSGGDGVPLWDSEHVEILGEVYPRRTGIPLFLAGESANMLATGIGEESLYRGIVYQGLSDEIGAGWAKVIDALFFPLLHLPQEISMIESGEMGWGDAARNFAIRSGITLLLDTAYDRGGLELSTAVHTWVNLASRLGVFLVSGGVE